MAIVFPAERRRPYAAAANVVSVLRRVRQRNLPEQIDGDFLRIAGISEIVYGRVLEALRFLGFIDEAGAPTDLLRSMSAAPEQEYRTLLEGALREAYRDDFARIDPSQDTQAQIVDAFAPYQPRSQTPRMVMLFLGLSREAGIPVLEAPRERQMQTPTRQRRGSRPTIARDPAQRASRQGQRSEGQRSTTVVAPGGLAGLTEADLVSLDEATFAEVWSVLGKALWRSRQANAKPPAAEGGEDA